MACNLPELRAFVAIARLGTFTRAAEALHLSQPALSRRVQLVEDDVGAALFERGRGGARLTEAGRAFLPHAEAALAQLEDAREAVRAVSEGAQGPLALAFVGTLGSSALTAALGRFRERFPRVRLALATATSDEVSRLVLRGEASLGLRYRRDADPQLACETIGAEALVLAGARHHRFAKRRALDPAQLAGETWIAFPERRDGAEDGYGRVLARFLAGAGLEGAERMTIDSLTAQKRLIEAGFGIGLLPETGVREELRAGSLALLKVPPIRPTVPICVVRRKRGYQSGAAERLVELLRATFAAPERAR